jgi:hypothetical protein
LRIKTLPLAAEGFSSTITQEGTKYPDPARCTRGTVARWSYFS